MPTSNHKDEQTTYKDLRQTQWRSQRGAAVPSEMLRKYKNYFNGL